MKIIKYLSFSAVLVSLVWVCKDPDFEPILAFMSSLVALIVLEINEKQEKSSPDEILNNLSKFYDLKLDLLDKYYHPNKDTITQFDQIYTTLITNIVSKYPLLEDEFEQLAGYYLPSEDTGSGIFVDKKNGIKIFQENYKKFVRKIK